MLFQSVCQCYSLLPQCGGGGSQGSRHREGWALYCDKLLGSLHHTLDSLYASVETGVYVGTKSELEDFDSVTFLYEKKLWNSNFNCRDQSDLHSKIIYKYQWCVIQ